MEAIIRESEQQARVSIVKWGVAGLLGTASIVTGGVVVAELAPHFAPIVANVVAGTHRVENDIMGEGGEEQEGSVSDGAESSDGAGAIQDAIQSVSDGARASDAATGTVPVDGPTVLFSSDWGNATGSGSSAYLDGSVWAGGVVTGTTPGEVRVTATDSRDFPTTNYLRTGAVAGQIFSGAGWDAPAVNDSIGLRYYYRRIGTVGDRHTVIFHNTGSGSWGPSALGVYVGATPTRWMISAASGRDARYFGPRSGSSMVTLPADVTYRIELLYVRTGTNAYTLRGRIYEVDGDLLYDTFCDGYWYGCTTGSGSTNGPVLESQTFSVTGAGASSMVGLVIGPEGAEGSSQEEFAAVAVCTSWCGDYPIAGVED